MLYRCDTDGFSDIATLEPLSICLKAQLELTGTDRLYYDIELPLCEVLGSMEAVGVKADTDGIKAFGVQLSAEIEQLTSQIYTYAGQNSISALPSSLERFCLRTLDCLQRKRQKADIPPTPRYWKASQTSTL